MTQRVYWVPHTVCYFGCAHCHNDSVMQGIRASRSIIDGVITNLPGPETGIQLEEVLVGGGEALMRGQQMEYLIERFRQRFPKGPQATLAERRAAGYVTLALQTMGHPLADAQGVPAAKNIQYWLNLGIDLFHIASNDMFHEQQRPDYPWEAFRKGIRQYGAEQGIEFVIYGKPPARLVPSGRVLQNLPELEQHGASLLTDTGYCATAWEAGAGFLSGQNQGYPHCSEVVIDPHGWVHPCCWHELAPGLFNLSTTPFADGMRQAGQIGFCHAIDSGDMIAYARHANYSTAEAEQIRHQVGDCGLCRLASVRLAAMPEYAWLKPTQLTDQEIRFYEAYIDPKLVV
jgi:hypothetical protein